MAPIECSVVPLADQAGGVAGGPKCVSDRDFAQRNSIEAVEFLMKPSLADGGLSASDSLDVHAAVEVVLRGIASGAVELPVRRASGEAKEEEELDAEDPWATVLRGDAQLRSLVADMRNAAGRSGAMARGGLGGGAWVARLEAPRLLQRCC